MCTQWKVEISIAYVLKDALTESGNFPVNPQFAIRI